jgi:type I restriction enzyme S subunit
MRLDEVCSEIVDCPHSTPLLTTHGFLIARSQDTRSGVFRLEQAGFVSEETYKERTRRAEPEHGDLLYSREGTYFGIAAEVPPNTKVCLGQRMVLLRPDPDVAHFRFLRYWLNSPILTSHIWGYRDGTVAERLNIPIIKALPVALPSLKEQCSIARVLSALDDKIELNRQMNRTLEAMAQALFKSWFVDFDPVTAKAAGRKPYGMNKETAALFPETFEDSAVGAIPRGWQLKPLDEIAHYENGLALQNFRPIGDEYLPVIKIRELRQGYSSSDSGKASPQIKASCIVDDGDVIFSWSGSLLVDIWCGGKGALNQHLFKVTSAKYSKWFYYFWTKEHLEDFQDIASDKATTMGHIQRHHLSSAQAVVPSNECLKCADVMMSPLLDALVNNNVQSRSLAALRDSLLPKLLSGEIRVGQTEKLVAEAA